MVLNSNVLSNANYFSYVVYKKQALIHSNSTRSCIPFDRKIYAGRPKITNNAVNSMAKRNEGSIDGHSWIQYVKVFDIETFSSAIVRRYSALDDAVSQPA
jgi:hypothetical protein